MRKISVLLLTTTVFLPFIGCTPAWVVTGKTFKTKAYHLRPPQEWMLINQGTATMISRHGPELEGISIIRYKIDEPLPATSIRNVAEMLPHEIGETILLQQQARAHVVDVALTHMSVTQVNSHEAVRVVLTYREGGQPFTDVVYGLIDGLFYYELRYSALTTHYFEKNLASFEEVVRDFVLR